MAKFDIYTATVHFTDKEESKSRPIIQIKDNPNAPNAFAMISGTKKKLYPGDVIITAWREAGLTEPSRVRLGERLDCPESIKTKNPLGKLSIEDAIEVQLQFKTPHKVKKHIAEELDDEFTINSILEDN